MKYITPNIKWQKYNKSKLKNGSIIIGVISDAKKITQPHAQTLIQCYIDQKNLNEIALSVGRTPGDILENEILPDKSNIKSGDFGEIFCRSVLQERKNSPKFPVLRWRNKSHRNDTVRGPDLIGYVIDAKNPSEKDLLLFCEVKTRSLSISKKIVKVAYDDVRKHYISKLANSIYFSQKWLLENGQHEEANNFSRFANPHENPYKRLLIPCIIHENNTWEDDFLEILPDSYKITSEYKTAESIELIVIRIDDLYDWINRVYMAAIDFLDKMI